MGLNEKEDFTIFEVDNNKFEVLGLLEKYKSYIWENKFCGVGTVEFWVPYNINNINLLQKDRIIWDGEENGAIIKYRKITKDNSTGDKLIYVKAYTLNYLLNTRIVWGVYSAENVKVSSIIYDLVNKNAVNPTVEKRKIPWLFLDIDTITDAETISKQVTDKNLNDVVLDMCSEKEYGYKIKFLPKQQKMLFTVIKGVDRTQGNVEGNDVVRFASDNDSVVGIEYEEDTSDECNVALVAGEDSGELRKTVIAGDDNLQGLERKELAVDARDVQSEYYDDEGEEHIIPEPEYLGMLLTRGNEKLDEHYLVQNFNSDIEYKNKEIVYNEDYFLGDKVTVEDKEIGIMLDAQVTETEESYTDGKGHDFKVIFGFGNFTLSEKIKSITS